MSSRSSVTMTPLARWNSVSARLAFSMLARSSCDLAELTMSVVRDCVPRAMEKRIDLGYEGEQPGAEGGQLQGNATLLKELIRNLVDNALNYTPSSAEKPGVITVRVLLDRFGKTLVLQVEDSGPGVPLAERELIFQPFYRSSQSIHVRGSGIGLSLVDSIMKIHQVALDVVSTQGKGTTFNLSFPALQA